MESKKNFIFDFDGTIADSLLVIFDVIKNSRFKFLLRNSEIRHFLAHDKDSTSETLAALLKSLEQSSIFSRLFLKLAKYEFGLHVNKVKPFEGILEVIKQIKASGHSIYIVTSNSKLNVKKFMRNNHINNEVSYVLGDVEVNNKQTSLLSLTSRLSLDTATTFYIGDEPRDVLAAKAAGLTSVAVSWGFASAESLQQENPDYVLSSPKQLSDLC